MLTRILKRAAAVAAVPLITILFSALYRSIPLIQFRITLLGTLSEVLVILVCRWDLRRLFRPSVELLSRLDVAHIPAPYRPGRFRADFITAGVLTWLAAAVPALVYAAVRFPQAATAPLRMAGMQTVPNLTLLILALAALLLGPAALALWAKFGQAVVIFSEISEKKRYLLRGFAEAVEKQDCLYRYLATLGRGSPTVR